jgi:SAM-dependent methyltransferase
MDIFNYNSKKLEYVPCNICGSKESRVIVRRTVNNLKANTVMCKVCSLVYINPRMAAKDYDEYYMSFYRQDRAAIKQKEIAENNLEKNFESARKFGHGIMKYMGQFVRDGLTIDVGSSTGGILYGMREAKSTLKLLGIEPSLDESGYANAKGVETIRGLFEDVQLDLKGKAANILCVQSLNHLLDPKKFLTWSHETLEDGGHVFLAVKNWKHQVRRMGKLSSGVQIDHVYMFTPETLKLLCEAAGFKVVYIDVDEGKDRAIVKKQKEDGLNTHHIRIVARKNTVPKELAIPCALYLKTRIALLPLMVKLVYLFKYSGRLAFLRRIFHS